MFKITTVFKNVNIVKYIYMSTYEILNVSRLHMLIWWLSNPPKVSALRGRHTGPTFPWAQTTC